MKTTTFALLGGLALASTQAYAFHCPMDMKKIDEAMGKNPQLSAEQMAEVKKLRAEGESLHKAGKHAELLARNGAYARLHSLQVQAELATDVTT